MDDNHNPAVKPCPFCGHVPRESYRNGSYSVGCFETHCPVRPKTQSTDVTLAWRKWNTRVEIPGATSLPAIEVAGSVS